MFKLFISKILGMRDKLKHNSFKISEEVMAEYLFMLHYSPDSPVVTFDPTGIYLQWLMKLISLKVLSCSTPNINQSINWQLDQKQPALFVDYPFTFTRGKVQDTISLNSLRQTNNLSKVSSLISLPLIHIFD